MNDQEDIPSLLGISSGESAGVPPPVASEPGVQGQPKQGASIGGWICLGLGLLCMYASLWLFIFYVPLLIASFALSISATSQRRLLSGIGLLVATIVLPVLLFFNLGVRRTKAAVDSITQRAQSNSPTTTLPNVRIVYDDTQFEFGPEVDSAEMINTETKREFAQALRTVVHKPSKHPVLRFYLEYDERQGAFVRLKSGFETLLILKPGNQTTNELRAVVAKALEWAATAKKERMSDYRKDIPVQFSSYRGYSSMFEVDKGRCTFTVPVATLRRHEWIPESEWDAILYMTDHMEEVLKPFADYYIPYFNNKRSEANKEAAEKRRKESLFK